MATVSFQDRQVQTLQDEQHHHGSRQRQKSTPPPQELIDGPGNAPEPITKTLPSRTSTGFASQSSQTSSRPSEQYSGDDEPEIFDYDHQDRCVSESDEFVHNSPAADSDDINSGHERTPLLLCRKRSANGPKSATQPPPPKRQQVTPAAGMETLSVCSSFSSVGIATPDVSTCAESEEDHEEEESNDWHAEEDQDLEHDETGDYDSEDDDETTNSDGWNTTERTWQCIVDLHDHGPHPTNPSKNDTAHPSRQRRCPLFASVRKVRRHLINRHACPPFCPACGERFGTYSECNAHIIESACEVNEIPPTMEGLSEGKVDELECLDWCEGMSEVGRHRMLWDVLYPGVEMPGV